IEVKNVVVHDLSRLWIQSLKDKIDGELNGKADVDVTLNNRIHVNSSGEKRIDKTTMAGFPTSKPIKLALIAENGRLKIRPSSATSASSINSLTGKPATITLSIRPSPLPLT